MDFETLETSLSNVGASSGAAEAHGTLCGAVCSGAAQNDGWLAQVLGDAAETQGVSASRALLQSLCKDVGRQFAAFDMNFMLLLPADTQPLALRVEALALWCQGFLFGLSLGASRDTLNALSEDAGEALHDLAEIARAGFEQGEGDTADEDAYAELAEYLRAAAQILYEDLNHAVPPPGADKRHAMLH